MSYAVARLRMFGAEPRRPHESWREWTTRVLRQPPFRRVKHPGNYAYVFGLNASARRRLDKLHGGGDPYPRRDDEIARHASGRGGALPAENGDPGHSRQPKRG